MVIELDEAGEVYRVLRADGDAIAAGHAQRGVKEHPGLFVHNFKGVGGADPDAELAPVALIGVNHDPAENHVSLYFPEALHPHLLL